MFAEDQVTSPLLTKAIYGMNLCNKLKLYEVWCSIYKNHCEINLALACFSCHQTQKSYKKHITLVTKIYTLRVYTHHTIRYGSTCKVLSRYASNRLRGSFKSETATQGRKHSGSSSASPHQTQLVPEHQYKPTG